MIVKSNNRTIDFGKFKQDLIDKVLNNLSTGEYQLEDVSCLCGNSSDYELITKSYSPNVLDSEMKVVLCKNCGLARTTPYFNSDSVAGQL